MADILELSITASVSMPGEQLKFQAIIDIRPAFLFRLEDGQ